jgi:diadenosine tetraphosphate (Ap4A) HIT family hydrolase
VELHPQLEKDCVVLGRFPLCQLLLVNDANYPWFILVPEREDIREIHALSDPDQVQLIRESSQLSRVLSERFHAHKMNVAALGNRVAQLHVHHVVRYCHDPAWPAPVWGKVAPKPYAEDELAQVIAGLKAALSGDVAFFV